MRRSPAASVSRTWRAWLSSPAASSSARVASSSCSAVAEVASAFGQGGFGRRRSPSPAPGAPPGARLGPRATRPAARASAAASASSWVSSLDRAREPSPRPRPGCGRPARAARWPPRRLPATWASCTCQWARCSRALSCSASSSASSAAGAAELLLDPAAGQLALDQCGVDLGQPLLRSGDPLGQSARAGPRSRPLRGRGCRQLGPRRRGRRAPAVPRRGPARRRRRSPRACSLAPPGARPSSGGLHRPSQRWPRPEPPPAPGSPARHGGGAGRRERRHRRGRWRRWHVGERGRRIVEDLRAGQCGPDPAGGGLLRPQPVVERLCARRSDRARDRAAAAPARQAAAPRARPEWP